MHSTPQHCSKSAPQLSVQAALQQTAQLLARAHIDTPQQEAHLLLRHVTGQSLTELMCNLQRTLSGDEAATLNRCVHRRLAREPLPYITGHATFRGRRINVNPHVLIPRPETELLIDVARDVVHQAAGTEQSRLFIDVGTGSGAIALSMACELQNARILAVDVSAQALQVARTNIAAYGATHIVELVRGHLVSMIATGVKADAIIANLPYVRTGDLANLAPEISRHEPWLALNGGRDGLSLVRCLCEDALRILKPSGWLLLEIGDSQCDAVRDSLSHGEWQCVEAIPDLAGIPRVVTACREPAVRR